MYLKLHTTEQRKILAVCDEGVVGKIFRDKGLKLEVTEHFFKGEQMDEKEAKEFIRREAPDSLNFAGKKAVQFAIKEGFIEKENILRVKGVPYAIALHF